MSNSVKGALTAVVLTVLWFLAVYGPCSQKRHDYERKTAAARERYEAVTAEGTSVIERRQDELDLINKVGYTRPTTDPEQMARMVQQLEAACVNSAVGLVEIVPMDREEVEGTDVDDGTGGRVKPTYFRHPVQIQVIGPLDGVVTLLSLLRKTNPAMTIDRMNLTSEENGLMRMTSTVSSWRPDISSLVPGGGEKK